MMPTTRKFPACAVLGAILAALGVAACSSGPAKGGRPAPVESLVPKPLRAESRPGEFALGPTAKIVVESGRTDLLSVAGRLKDGLRGSTGLDLAVGVTATTSGRDRAGDIALRLEDLEARLGTEGYLLEVGKDGAILRAAAPAGLFYAVQTLLQLVPSRAAIPCVSIEDRPRFAWRGALLDCARHFFPKEFVKRWIDILAMHKLNTFHWHLTDDQGWRVEIKKYPRLPEVGAWRVDREGSHWNAREPQRPGEAATYGGFYTQDDIREVVAYAESRFVTIVPEIEMPGHAKAALTAYPVFSCTGGPFTVPPGGYWPITDVFCPGNDGTFAFLEDVLDEVAGLFPGRYIHIGGDEVDKAEWKRCPRCQARMKAEGLKDETELQSWFVRRVEALLNSKGRDLVGWDEILEGGLAPRATVMSWRGTEGGVAAARSGHDVIMSPTSHCYIDYYQGDPAYEPLAIGGFLPLEKVYAFEPVPDVLTEAEAAHVLGGQANLWTEYIAEGRHAEYMALPRLAALAEAVWTPKAGRDWPDFASRLGALLARYDEAGLNNARSAYLVRVGVASIPGKNRAAAALAAEVPGLDIRYTTDGADPTPASKRYVKPLGLRTTTEVRAAAFEAGRRLSPAVASERFLVHAASGRLPSFGPASIPSLKYAAGGAGALTDGLTGSKNHDDGRWQGFEGTDLEAVVDLGQPRPVRNIATRCLQNINAWIFLPTSVEYAVSEDGRTFEIVAALTNDVSPRLADVLVKEFAAPLDGRTARFVRVRAKAVGLVPEWHHGAGGKAWLFVDELVIE